MGALIRLFFVSTVYEACTVCFTISVGTIRVKHGTQDVTLSLSISLCVKFMRVFKRLRSACDTWAWYFIQIFCWEVYDVTFKLDIKIFQYKNVTSKPEYRTKCQLPKWQCFSLKRLNWPTFCWWFTLTKRSSIYFYLFLFIYFYFITKCFFLPSIYSILSSSLFKGSRPVPSLSLSLSLLFSITFSIFWVSYNQFPTQINSKP